MQMLCFLCFQLGVTSQTLFSVPPEPEDDRRAARHRDRESKLGTGRERAKVELVSRMRCLLIRLLQMISSELIC